MVETTIVQNLKITLSIERDFVLLKIRRVTCSLKFEGSKYEFDLERVTVSNNFKRIVPLQAGWETFLRNLSKETMFTGDSKSSHCFEIKGNN